jgi:hypothetical protein
MLLTTRSIRSTTTKALGCLAVTAVLLIATGCQPETRPFTVRNELTVPVHVRVNTLDASYATYPPNDADPGNVAVLVGYERPKGICVTIESIEVTEVATGKTISVKPVRQMCNNGQPVTLVAG